MCGGQNQARERHNRARGLCSALPPAMQGFGTVLAKASLSRPAGCGELGDGVGGVMGARGATAPEGPAFAS